MLNIHEEIKYKLNYFIEKKKIPNIIFHGLSGCGKNMLVKEFISNIYNGNKEDIQSYVMNVNCARGKGIRFIREELKFFAKSNIDLKEGEMLKIIVLLNADKLTTDAQSALRRCIELFSHSTRFFIIVEDKYKLLKPILSRFCEIHVSLPMCDTKPINLHEHHLNSTYEFRNSMKKQRMLTLKKILTTVEHDADVDVLFVNNLYELGYSSLDIIEHIKNLKNININELRKYECLVFFEKIRVEIRNEKLLMFFILNFWLFRSNINLENIS